MDNREEYTPLIVIGFIIFIMGLFALIIWNSGRRHPMEKNKLADYQERCGGRFGVLNMTYPFVRVSFYDTFFVIGHFKKILIRYTHIVRLDEIGSKGIDFVTKTGERPIIRTFNKQKIIQLVKYRKSING
jgi:hypothetical protein